MVNKNNRREVLKYLLGASLISAFPSSVVKAERSLFMNNNTVDDRKYWVSVLARIAEPILLNISKQELRKNMPMVVSPSYDKRDPGVGYLEAFGRLLAGMAPWLALPNDGTEEGKLRKKFRSQALLGIRYGVDPNSADYFTWRSISTTQPLVDAAYLAQAFLRAPQALWQPLSDLTKNRVIEEFKQLRRIKPNESNWLLFAATVETFLYSVGVEPVRDRIDYAVHKFDKDWYVGDGWYSDGAKFSFDHYNGYVIHSMQVETLQHNINAGNKYKEMYDRAYKRMQRYAHHLERMIAQDGTYVVVGRSSTYRTAAFQPLASVVLDNKLPNDLTKGGVRAALTAVMKHVFVDATVAPNGWLTMGVVGDKQTNLADYYTNVGSLYITSLSFLPLGLPANDEFWTTAPEKWTAQKVYAGEVFPKDYHVNY